MEISDIKYVDSEAGIVASLIFKPELSFYSEHLRASHFTVEENAYMYFALCEIAKRKIPRIDPFNIMSVLDAQTEYKNATQFITIKIAEDYIAHASALARSSVNEYMVLVDNVLNAAFRRHTFKKLQQCQRLCFDLGETDIEQKIYTTLDEVMLEFATTNEVPQYKDVVDELWSEIQERANGSSTGIPFKFPSLNNYATIEPGELFLFAAEAKQGKSMILLNCTVDMLRQGKAVLYLDSELNSRLFTCRLISHLTGIEFSRVRSGDYNEEESTRIDEQIAWLKTRNFTHIYIPMFDEKSIYAVTKKIKHSVGLDVLVVDYFKSSADGDAWTSYAELGRFVDTVKNKICGDMGVAGLGAVQATSAGKIADSAKISRNASTIALITDKTPEEVEADGLECGNKKLRVLFNRNGAQMSHDEYIDLRFNGNLILYEEAVQHAPFSPF